MFHAERVHHLYGAVDATGIGVHAVVVARGEHVEATVDGSLEILVGGAELWVAFVRRSAECHLEVGNGDVGTLYLGCHVVEHTAVVVGAVGGACRLDLWLVLHDVAAEEQCHLVLLRLCWLYCTLVAALGIAHAA